jgi:hypothetical protein
MKKIYCLFLIGSICISSFSQISLDLAALENRWDTLINKQTLLNGIDLQYFFKVEYDSVLVVNISFTQSNFDFSLGKGQGSSRPCNSFLRQSNSLYGTYSLRATCKPKKYKIYESLVCEGKNGGRDITISLGNINRSVIKKRVSDKKLTNMNITIKYSITKSIEKDGELVKQDVFVNGNKIGLSAYYRIFSFQKLNENNVVFSVLY